MKIRPESHCHKLIKTYKDRGAQLAQILGRYVPRQNQKVDP